MGKTHRAVSWIGEKGSEGKEVVKMATTAIVVVGALAVTGAVLGTVGKAFGSGK